MFHSSVFHKIRVFGLKGIVGFVLSVGRRMRMRQDFKRTIQKDPPTPGITVIGDFHQWASYSKVLRDFVKALYKAQIPFQTFEIHSGDPVVEDSFFDSLCTPPSTFCLNRYSRIVTGWDALFFPGMKGVKQYRIVFWEFDSGILDFLPMLLEKNKGVIAMSDFNFRYFRTILPSTINVVKIPYPLPECSVKIEAREVVRSRYGIGSNDFMVYFNFELRYARKNPEGCLRAFAEALADDNSAKLVFKIHCPKESLDELKDLRALANDLNIADKIVFITDFLPESAIYGLTNACDVYMSLHRGEGFGLGIAEAMSLAKPVIVTDWSASTEFCSLSNSLPVRYKLVPIKPFEADKTAYRGVIRWAEPDISHAATMLRTCRNNPDFAREIGERGRETMKKKYSLNAFREAIASFI
jgi:glycosyltransferase involved in cell wall biosynthesis